MLEVFWRGSKLVKYCKTCKTYIGHLNRMKRKKVKSFTIEAKRLQPGAPERF